MMKILFLPVTIISWVLTMSFHFIVWLLSFVFPKFDKLLTYTSQGFYAIDGRIINVFLVAGLLAGMNIAKNGNYLLGVLIIYISFGLFLEPSEFIQSEYERKARKLDKKRVKELMQIMLKHELRYEYDDGKNSILGFDKSKRKYYMYSYGDGWQDVDKTYFDKAEMKNIVETDLGRILEGFIRK